MPTFTCDSEGAALIQAALTVMDAVLQARMVRADPDAIISNSLKLQRHKTDAILRDLQTPRIERFTLLPREHQETILRVAQMMLGTTDTKVIDATWARFRELVLQPPLPPADTPLIDWLAASSSPVTKDGKPPKR